MVKKILFICKHNLFRSQVAEVFFKKINRNKNYIASGAGLIGWNKKDLKGDEAYRIEKIICKKEGVPIGKKSKPVTSSLLKNTNILVIVADNVPSSIFKDEKSFKGKIIVWKTRDVKFKDKNKDRVALNTIKFIKNKVKDFAKNLK